MQSRRSCPAAPPCASSGALRWATACVAMISNEPDQHEGGAVYLCSIEGDYAITNDGFRELAAVLPHCASLQALRWGWTLSSVCA